MASRGNQIERLRALIIVVSALVAALATSAASASESDKLTRPIEEEALEQPASGHFVEPAKDVLSEKGEVPIEYDAEGKPARRLHEELDDGELEGGDHHTAWSYLNQKSWEGEYPQCRGGNLRQSPIDIQTDNLVFNSRLKLEYIDYNQEVEFEYKNTHHSISLTPICSIGAPALRVNWVASSKNDSESSKDNEEQQAGQVYDLQEIHFHWGDGINKGSEHEINDQRAAAEMHMVHYRRGLDKNKIGTVENSVVVLAVLIESDALEHNKLEGLVDRSRQVNGTDLEYKDNNPENLINLLPNNHHSFYTYNGSLTTPPCYEVVTWVVMSEPVFMSQARLVELSNLEVQTPGGLGRKKISSNHRDIQPLLDRHVYASFNASDTNTYELSGDFEMKHIGGRTSRFSKAIDEYWKRVNQLQVSVKRAYGALTEARKRFLAKLATTRVPESLPPPPPPTTVPV